MNDIIPVLVAVLGFLITVTSGFIFIPYLKKLHFGQTILDIGPKWHKSKQGTPIMGGLMFIAGTLISVGAGIALCLTVGKDSGLAVEMASRNRVIQLVAGVLMALLMAFIGFMDDYIKAVKKQNLGLRAMQKTILQLLVCTTYLATLCLAGMRTTHIPFIGDIDITSGFGILFWPAALVFIYGFTNAVNLTDGVDGLASSVTIVVAMFYTLAALSFGYFGYSLLSTALVGSLIGFLVWNLNPAKVFMGDTGSMFLGGMVVALSFSFRQPILLFLSGFLYLAEAMSVVIQVAHYKRTKKRLFKMSPIHHHFEMCGWKENKIVIVFSFVALLGCLLAYIAMFY